MPTTEHRPGRWQVVSDSDDSVTVSAMCVCGDDDCHYTGTVYDSNWVHSTPRRVIATCPAYCPCRVLDERGETPRQPDICPYEAAHS